MLLVMVHSRNHATLIEIDGAALLQMTWKTSAMSYGFSVYGLIAVKASVCAI